MNGQCSIIRFTFFITAVLSLIGMPAQAADYVGSFVNLRGTANILRATISLSAKLKDPVRIGDTIETLSRSRTKLLFLDESILTIGSDSRASIEKFLYSRKEGRVSIFNLMEGRMRSVVGKTAFEVHTPTVVAAARGTVIDFLVGKAEGVPFTKVTCLEGTVLIRSIDPAIVGLVELKAGQTITVLKNKPLPRPRRAPIRKIDKKTKEEAAEDPFGKDDLITTEFPLLPPIEQEPVVTR